ncbi:MAG: chromate transporter [Acidobacteriia bacterium]|nr:chromate transporter [Terriglobia bacterium]
MNVFLLYLLLVKATLLSFSGLSSLPIIHHDLVAQRGVLTDRQLNTSVAVARMGPGPLGLYLVCVGYFTAGIPGAIAGCLAMMTPAFLIIPLMRFIGRRAEHEAVQRTIRAVILAAAGLLLAATIPMAQDALASPLTVVVAVISLVLLVRTKVDTVWVILGAAAVGLTSHALTLLRHA